jgi:phage baseplate assembly protein gpV
MYDGLKLYKAIVAGSSTSTGAIHVKIPSILGPNESIEVSKVGRSASGGVWAVPAVGTQVVVGVDDNSLSNVYLMYTSVDNTLSSSISTLETDISTLETDIATLETDVETLETTVDGLVEDVAALEAGSGLSITAVTGSYTLQTSDAGKLIQVNSSSAVTISVPTTGFATGDEIYIATIGTGKVTVGGAATVNAPSGVKTLVGQYSTAALVKLSSYWILFGDLG